jgi:hypothetical protein
VVEQRAQLVNGVVPLCKLREHFIISLHRRFIREEYLRPSKDEFVDAKEFKLTREFFERCLCLV